MTTQDQLDTLLNNDALQVLVDLMGYITGAPKGCVPVVQYALDPMALAIELSGAHGAARIELFPRTEKLH